MAGTILYFFAHICMPDAGVAVDIRGAVCGESTERNIYKRRGYGQLDIGVRAACAVHTREAKARGDHSSWCVCVMCVCIVCLAGYVGFVRVGGVFGFSRPAGAFGYSNHLWIDNRPTQIRFLAVAPRRANPSWP